MNTFTAIAVDYNIMHSHQPLFDYFQEESTNFNNMSENHIYAASSSEWSGEIPEDQDIFVQQLDQREKGTYEERAPYIHHSLNAQMDSVTKQKHPRLPLYEKSQKRRTLQIQVSEDFYKKYNRCTNGQPQQTIRLTKQITKYFKAQLKQLKNGNKLNKFDQQQLQIFCSIKSESHEHLQNLFKNSQNNIKNNNQQQREQDKDCDSLRMKITKYLRRDFILTIFRGKCDFMHKLIIIKYLHKIEEIPINPHNTTKWK